ncbi:hypothetical protein MAR_015468, partial [Mya arenaria]
MDSASLRSDESYTPIDRQRATTKARYGRESTVTPSSDAESVSCLTPSTLGAGRGTLPCDVCEIEANHASRYCPHCCQKMCGLCEEMHARFGGTLRHTTVQCMSKSKHVDEDLLQIFRERYGLNFCQAVDLIKTELGLQVCANYISSSVTLLADDDQVLDLVCDTVKQLGNDTINQSKDITKRVKQGKIEWTICGESAIITLKLFVDKMTLFSEHHSVVVTVFSNGTRTSWTKFVEASSDRCSSQSGRISRQADQYLRQAQKKHLFDSMSDLRDIDTKITVTCDPEAYTEVDYGLRDIVDALHTVAMEEVARPDSDVFRLRVYALLKETDSNVLCLVKQTDSGYKLGIRAKDKDTVQATKQEFLSIFCKECSHCQRECSSPVYLACKHVLCSGCVDPSLTTTAQCPLCADQLREKTPIISLQVQAFQALDRTLDRPLHQPLDKTYLGNRARTTKSSYTAQTQVSLQRKEWKRVTGGLGRLRALLEQNFGLRVGGTGDRLAIYGHQQEILDLAVHTLEHLNESVPKT